MPNAPLSFRLENKGHEQIRMSRDCREKFSPDNVVAIESVVQRGGGTMQSCGNTLLLFRRKAKRDTHNGTSSLCRYCFACRTAAFCSVRVSTLSLRIFHRRVHWVWEMIVYDRLNQLRVQKQTDRFASGSQHSSGNFFSDRSIKRWLWIAYVVKHSSAKKIHTNLGEPV